MWRCPHCQNPLALTDRSWRCAKGHNFDCAKEGYVNLLPANARRSRSPGDSAEMIAARHRVHQAGLYQPLADALAEMTDAVAPEVLLDLGCGEGFYTRAVARGIPTVLGIDIARAAVKIGAKQLPQGRFAVASSFQVPLPDGCVDAVIRVFAPCDDGELARVLKPGGRYIEVSPAPNHLWQLRERLYDTPIPHAESRDSIAGFRAVNYRREHYPVKLYRSQLGDLVAMTPFAHRGHREKRERLLEADAIEVEMSFSLREFVRE